MRISLFKRQFSLIVFGGLILLFMLTACGGGSGSPSNSITSTTPTATTVPATATETAMIPLMTLVGQPTAKLVSGHHVFEADGSIKNGDTKQHDIYVQATLLDASGAVVGSTAFFNVDNVPGGGTESFAIQGTTIQPTWTTVQVKVIAVTENIGSSSGG